MKLLAHKEVVAAVIGGIAVIVAALISRPGPPEHPVATVGAPTAVANPTRQAELKTPLVADEQPAPVLTTAQEQNFQVLMEGHYSLLSLTLNGLPLPTQGSMQLTETAQNNFHFTSTLWAPSGFPQFHYSGEIYGNDESWFIAITDTDDMTVFGTPPQLNQISREGNLVTFRSYLGQTAVWQRE